MAQWPTDWKRSVYITIPKLGDCTTECTIYRTISLISHANEIVFPIIQCRLELYVENDVPDIQAGYRRGWGTNYCWYTLDYWESRRITKEITVCVIDHRKAFDWVDHIKLWNKLRKMISHCPYRKLIYRSGSHRTDRTWWNKPAPDWQRSVTRLSILPLFVWTTTWIYIGESWIARGLMWF